MSDSCRKVLVSGDIVLDHYVYQGNRSTPNAAGRGSAVKPTVGGAYLAREILDAAAGPFLEEYGKAGQGNNERQEGKSEGSKQPLVLLKEPVGPPFSTDFGLDINVTTDLPPCLHSYAMWQPVPQAKEDEDNKVWRLKEALGYGENENGELPYSFADHKAACVDANHDVVVLDDAALGFRFNQSKDAWPAFLRNQRRKAPRWIVLKMSAPVAKGDLFRELTARFADRLVVVLGIGDIRREEVNVSKALSWERTATELAWELSNNPTLAPLLNCRHLVVTFRSEGALWVSNGRQRQWRMVLDPANVEEEWEAGYPARVFGYLSCVNASIAAWLAAEDLVTLQIRQKTGKGKPTANEVQEEAMERGIKNGLAAMRTLQVAGHGPADDPATGFPAGEVACSIAKGSTDFHTTLVPQPGGLSTCPNPDWRILEEQHGIPMKSSVPLYGIARRTLLFGQDELQAVPHASFGRFFTADRGETEALRGLQRLVTQYRDKSDGKRPLSLAVFGPPGAGKSFAVKELATSLLSSKTPFLEFNLSQFDGPEDLVGALHQVRDSVLKGALPVVFWDEFDSEENKWLQYFLAPMQDGAFQEGQLTHPVGKCIFVFAGGTCATMQEFDLQEPVPPSGRVSGAAKEAHAAAVEKHRFFKLAKGPDFVSRLQGYLNVLGPNPKIVRDTNGNARVDTSDVCFPVRRALLIRGMLRLKPEKPLAIDRGLATALLEVARYKRGSRSVDKLLEILRGGGGDVLRRSQLPPGEVLSMHVDAPAFMALTQRGTDFEHHAKKLAPAVHGFYRGLAKKKGWTFTYDAPYSRLPEDVKEANVAAASRVFRLLQLVGLEAIPQTQAKQDRRLTLPDKELGELLQRSLERLAEEEHNGWMDERRTNGYRYAKKRDDSNRHHPAMVPYAALSEEDKEKDRDNVRNIPDIVKKAHYAIVAPLWP
jgi:RyR domain/ATPase family associated with various cellular activities (AAA)